MRRKSTARYVGNRHARLFVTVAKARTAWNVYSGTIGYGNCSIGGVEKRKDGSYHGTLKGGVEIVLDATNVEDAARALLDAYLAG